MKIRSLALTVTLVAAALGSTVACGGTVETPQTTASAVTKAPVGVGTHGFVKIVGEALGEVPLRAEQRTELEKMAQAAEARHAPMATGRKELMAQVADQIEAGAIDRAALQPKIDRVVADLEKVRGEDRAALSRLHAILDADQRNAFVDALEKQLHAKRGDHFQRMKEGVHGFAKMKALADEMKLTDEQRTQIKDALREMHKEHMAEGGEGRHHGPAGAWRRGGDKARAHHAGGKRVFESFRQESFDLDEAAPPMDIKAKTAEGATRMIAVAEKILPILTPEQRKVAADKLRQAAASGDAMPFER